MPSLRQRSAVEWTKHDRRSLMLMRRLLLFMLSIFQISIYVRCFKVEISNFTWFTSTSRVALTGPMWCIHEKFLVKILTYHLRLWRAWAPQTNEHPIIILFVMTCLLFKTTFPLASHFRDGHFKLGHFWAPETWTLGEKLRTHLELLNLELNLLLYIWYKGGPKLGAWFEIPNLQSSRV